MTDAERGLLIEKIAEKLWFSRDGMDRYDWHVLRKVNPRFGLDFIAMAETTLVLMERNQEAMRERAARAVFEKLLNGPGSASAVMAQTAVSSLPVIVVVEDK